MKGFMILAVTIICCLYLAFAAPAGKSPGVKFLKYENDKEFEEIQKQIIAQYDHLGGSSQVYPVQTAQVVDPNNLKINF